MKVFELKEGVSGKLFLLVGTLFFIFCIWYVTRPVLLIETEEGILFSMRAESGIKFSTRFIHSVQKTPVKEYFTVNEDCSGFILESTRYRSFGVGLPFLESDGTFHREGDDFIMDNLNRQINTLDLRTSVGTELSITINDQTLPLYDMMPAGSLVRVSIIQNYQLWSKNFND